MSRGRIFPIRSPYRDFPYDPMQNADNQRNAPLPFQIGAGSSTDIETTVAYRVILQTTIYSIPDPNNPVSVPTSCSSLTNQFCVPIGRITKAPAPVGTIRCAIT